MFNYKDIFENKSNILFCVAHPDDADVFFGGLITRLKNDGKQVRIVLVTTGARGSRENEISEEELAKKRLEEQSNALSHYGLEKEDLICLGYRDGEVENNIELVSKIAKEIRSFEADVVCAHHPGVFHEFLDTKKFFINHRDHRNSGQSALDAVYPFARDISFFPDHYDEGLRGRVVMDVLLTGDFEVNTQIDITDVIEDKKKGMQEHKSQFNDELIEMIIDDNKSETGFIESFFYLPLLW